MRSIILLSFFACFACASFGQVVTTQLSKETLLVGELFEIQFEMPVDEGARVKMTPFNDFLKVIRARNEKNAPDTVQLEILESFRDTTENIQGKWYWRAKYVVMAFDTGYLILPPTSLIYKGTEIEVPPTLIRVNFVPQKEGKDFYDIQEEFAQIPEEEGQLWTWIKEPIVWITFAILLAVLAFVWWRRKQHKDPLGRNNFTDLNAADKALIELEELIQKELWRKGELKEHFSLLSMIVRRYLSEEYDQNFLERTSFEIQFILRQRGLNEWFQGELGLILNGSDMVKFAKSQVENNGVEQINSRVKNFIQTVQNR